MQLPIPTPLQRSVSASIVFAAGVAAFLILNAIINDLNIRSLIRLRTQVQLSNRILAVANDLLANAQAAESGQRGYHITEDQRYLIPFESARIEKDRRLTELHDLLNSDQPSSKLMPEIEAAVNAKFEELAEALRILRDEGREAARAHIRRDDGRARMMELGAKIRQLERLEDERLNELTRISEDDAVRAKTSGWVTMFIGIGLVGFGFFYLRRDAVQRERFSEYLVEQEQSRNNFLALLGHELRNPLAAIRSSLDVMSMMPDLSANLENLRAVMDRQAKLMIRLADDLLDTSRIHYNKLRLQSEPLELGELAKKTIQDFVEAHRFSGVSIDYRAPEVALWVRGDSARLAQVLLNLLHNALKFSHRGGNIKVVLRKYAEDRAELSVTDDGEGMDEATLRKLFGAFSQGHAVSDRNRGGLGLGLSLSKALVEFHSGTIEGESAGLGKGSRFTVTLPLSAKPENTMSDIKNDPGETRPCRIVIIDDRRDASYPLQRMLELLGHEVHVAVDAESGIELALNCIPNLVLCDIGLPGALSGHDVARTLRNTPATRETFLVAVTGFGQEEDRAQSAAAGFHRHLTKPVSLNGLHEIIAAIPCGAPVA